MKRDILKRYQLDGFDASRWADALMHDQFRTGTANTMLLRDDLKKLLNAAFAAGKEATEDSYAN